jgi:molybdopterin converting factor small subunit
MPIRVEFYGIARQRAGIGELALPVEGGHSLLGEVLHQLATRLPALGAELIAGGQLHDSLTANLDGIRFIRDPDSTIRDGQCLLLLSADAGG